jgi:hypothetical protein
LRIDSSETRDIIRVLPRVFRFDLARGRAEIRVSMPDEFEGRQLTLWITGQNIRSDCQRATVQEGWLQFVFPTLQPDSYAMGLEVPGISGRVYLPGTMDSFAADSLTVVTDRIAVYEADIRNTHASISGSISGSWLEAPSGRMRIEAFSADAHPIASTWCLPDGSFTFYSFLPKELRLRSEFRGIKQWIGGDSFETARVFDLQPGDRITDVAMVESGFRVRLDGPGDLAFHRPTVLVRDESGNEYHPDVFPDNPFSVCNLRPGRYYLHLDGHCNDQIWAAQWYGGTERMEDAIPIDLGEGEYRHLVMELVEGGRIEGGVLTSDGQPPEKASCRIFDFEGEPLCSGWGQWRVFEEGLFSFTGLTDGEYFLAARTVNYEPWWYPGTADFAEATPITITDHATVTGISWSLPQPGKEARP